MKNALMGFINKVKKSVEEESAESELSLPPLRFSFELRLIWPTCYAGFVTGGAAPVGQLAKASGLARSKTIAALRNPDRVKEKKSDSEMKASEVGLPFSLFPTVLLSSAERALPNPFPSLLPTGFRTRLDPDRQRRHRRRSFPHLLPRPQPHPPRNLCRLHDARAVLPSTGEPVRRDGAERGGQDREVSKAGDGSDLWVPGGGDEGVGGRGVAERPNVSRFFPSPFPFPLLFLTSAQD
jgi:hypothetical protein